MSPIADLLICLRFLSRLPVPATARERRLGRAGLSHAAAMIPVAALVIALVPVGTIAALRAAGLSATLAAALGVLAQIAVTGAMHEDGLADCADALGAWDRGGKLTAMRDSRIGTFGALALGLSVLIRTAAIADLLGRGLGVAAVVIMMAAVLSRSACLAPLHLPPARADGLGEGVGRPAAGAVVGALALSAGVLLVASSRVGMGAAGGAAALAALLAGLPSWWAWRYLRGQTGDVAGATQQLVECGVLVLMAGLT